MDEILRWLIFRRLPPIKFALLIIGYALVLALSLALAFLMIKALRDGQFPSLTTIGINAAGDYPAGVSVGMGTLSALSVSGFVAGLIILAFFQRMLDSGQSAWLGIGCAAITIGAVGIMGYLAFDFAMGGLLGPKRTSQATVLIILLMSPAVIMALLRPKSEVCSV